MTRKFENTYHRQFLSGICYSRGDVWIPLVMLERIVMGAILILQSALEDMRKLSPDLFLPEIVPDSHKTSWWEDLCGWKNSPVRRTLVAFGRPTTFDVPAKPDLMMDLEPEFVKIRESLDEAEDASLNRKAAGTVLDRAGIAQHRNFDRPDNRVAAKGGKRGKGSNYRPVIPVIKHPYRYSDGDERRKRDAAKQNRRLASVGEHSPLDVRGPSASDTRQAGRQRHAQLTENHQTLQRRIENLQTELRGAPALHVANNLLHVRL